MEEGDQPRNVYNIQVQAETVNIVGEQHVGQMVSNNFNQGVSDGLSEDAENFVSGMSHDSSANLLLENSKINDRSSSGEGETRLSAKIVMYNKRPLCEGGKVFLGRQEYLPGHYRNIAIKLIQYHEKKLKEIDFLTKLNHSNVSQIIDAGEYHGLGHWIYIAMELCSQNLQQYVDENRSKPLDFEKSFQFAKQLAAGLAFIHDNKIIHRDLKPDNILISACKDCIKLSDFGLSKQMQESRSVATVTSIGDGSEGYRAPETYRRSPHVSPQLDIFPLGLIFHLLFTNGKHPFGSDPYDWRENIRRNKNLDLSEIPQFPKPYSHKRSQLIDLLKEMLQKYPHDRPTAKEVQKHPFFEDVSQIQREDSLRKVLSLLKNIFVSKEEQSVTLMKKSKFQEALEILQEIYDDESDESEKLDAALKIAECELHLWRGKEEESMQNVKRLMSKSKHLSFNDILNMAEKLKEKYPIRSLILFRISGDFYEARNFAPDDALQMLRSSVISIAESVEALIENGGRTRDIGINYGLSHMERLSRDVCAIKDASPDEKAISEATCLAKITHVCAETEQYEKCIHYCLDGISTLERELGAGASIYLCFGELLHNLGRAHHQTGQYLDAERHYETAIEAKMNVPIYDRAMGVTQIQRSIDVTKKYLAEVREEISSKN